ncbi:FecR family protein [Polynucleobacter hirudinilacicola]|nr:FecR family protein [Polynucleobacter hirudinilacicola]
MLLTSPHLFKYLPKVLLGAILACALASPIFAQSTAEVGRILLALGDTKLIRKGQSSALTKGATLQAGDTITTGVNSNLQMRMTDGAVIALRAGSEFKIDEYQFNGKSDGTEKASLNLVQGGVRAVTGVIGRENKDNLKVNTVAATIGVRGTGFNIVDCSNSCLGADKALAKNGLYAGVFEGKVVVKNDASEGTYGVNEPIYVASKTAPIDRLSEPPAFLRDPLASQVIVPKKAASVVQPIQQPVNPPKEPADVVVGNASTSLTTIGPVTIFQTPNLLWNFPANIYNTTYNDGSTVATGYSNYVQIAQAWPGSTNPSNGLPYYSINPSLINTDDGGGFAATYSASGFLTQVSLASAGALLVPGPQPQLPNLPPVLAYTQGSAQLLEGGNYQNVSWGRWGNGTVSQIAGYNNGQPIYVPIDSGIHLVAGQLNQDMLNATINRANSISFTLLRATTPTAINGGQSWFVTGGNLTANIGAATINGNLGLFSTTSGNANYNMAFSGGLTGSANNIVNGTVSNTTGNQGVCKSGCAASGNVSFYNTPVSAAGLSYNFNTGTTFVQGVAVYKR